MLKSVFKVANHDVETNVIAIELALGEIEHVVLFSLEVIYKPKEFIDKQVIPSIP